MEYGVVDQHLQYQMVNYGKFYHSKVLYISWKGAWEFRRMVNFGWMKVSDYNLLEVHPEGQVHKSRLDSLHWNTTSLQLNLVSYHNQEMENGVVALHTLYQWVNYGKLYHSKVLCIRGKGAWEFRRMVNFGWMKVSDYNSPEDHLEAQVHKFLLGLLRFNMKSRKPLIKIIDLFSN